MLIFPLYLLLGPLRLLDRDSTWSIYVQARTAADAAANALHDSGIVLTPFVYRQAPQDLLDKLTTMRASYASAGKLHEKYVRTYMTAGTDAYADQLLCSGFEYLLASKAYSAETTFASVESLPSADHTLKVKNRQLTYRSTCVFGIYLAYRISDLYVDPPYTKGPPLGQTILDYTSVIGQLHFDENGLPVIAPSPDEREVFTDQFDGLAAKPPHDAP